MWLIRNQIDKQWQLYLKRVWDQEEAITASAVVAIACGSLVSNKFNCAKLVEFGGQINLSWVRRQWATKLGLWTRWEQNINMVS